MQLLLRGLHQRYGCLPRSYFAWDTEFTGFRKEDDLIWNLGACRVEDGQIVQQANIVLDWTRHKLIEEAWLQRRIQQQRAGMRAAGRECHLSWYALQNGVPPEEGMTEFLQMLTAARAAGLPFAGHGIIKCDVPRVAYQFKEWLGETWTFRRNEVIDTAAIEKACEAGLHPKPQETFFDYAKRVLHARAPGVKWNMDRIVQKFDFARRYGFREKDQHGAGSDAYLIHLLLEDYRTLSGL